MRPATPEEIAGWDKLVAANPDGGNVLQSKAFAETKALHGWEPLYFMLGEVAVLVLSREVPLLGEIWYICKGPGVTVKEGLEYLSKQLPYPPPFMVKIEPEIAKGQIGPAELNAFGFEKVRDIQYNVSTVIVSLEPSEDEIISGFKQKTRYNVRLAAKKGVSVEPAGVTEESIDQMYALMQATVDRAGVYLRDRQYFADFWRLHSEAGSGQMFFAKYEGQILAGAFITYLGEKALYKDGGSVREHSDVQAPYLLQWEIMKWLKAKGIKEYDLHGTPPAEDIENSEHPLAGLARFKTGFNAEVTEFIGTYDLPVHKRRYQIWAKFGQRLAMAYAHRVKKRLFY
ncbi:MAG TPA: peptidoglycan bridge formation glycyltransferase FemA/FemB family protein [Candidatus Saccharimonadales bacterium]|nr:peptidoglycan bridge formation glycyltransferase FemA/FemB family protein [Candidatus Saccharimonadales bacterium]